MEFQNSDSTDLFVNFIFMPFIECAFIIANDQHRGSQIKSIYPSNFATNLDQPLESLVFPNGSHRLPQVIKTISCYCSMSAFSHQRGKRHLSAISKFVLTYLARLWASEKPSPLGWLPWYFRYWFCEYSKSLYSRRGIQMHPLLLIFIMTVFTLELSRRVG